MVNSRRLRSVLNTLALYTIAGLVIGYFGVNAYTGNRGLKAKQDLDQQIAQLNGELAALKAERVVWERRVSLLATAKSRPGHAGRARPRAAQLCRSPRTDAPGQALTTGSGARGAGKPSLDCLNPVVSPAGALPHALSPRADFGY